MKLLSIVVPCYNEQEVLPIYYNEMTNELNGAPFNYEIIFVNDGSRDNTLSVLKELAEKDSRIKYISFSRNFGKEAAMFAGFEGSKGDYVAVMDVDLQDPPSLIRSMFETLEGGEFDCVATRRVTRKGEPPIRSFFARTFYKLINKISSTEIVDGARDFRMMTRQMADSIISLQERNRFSKGLFSWVGFNTKWLEYENRERAAGETKWNFWKLFLYSLDGIVAFSTAPLAAASVLGVLFCIFAFVMIVFFVVRTLMFGDPVAGYPSLISFILLIGGVQLLTFGVLGQYMAKTYLETKNRPIYITKESNIDETDK